MSTSSPDIDYGSLAALAEGPFHDLNAQFVLNSGYLVFFMHCGFAMISVGCVRQRFAKHVALLVLMDSCASALGWYLTGYAFAWGDNTTADGNVNGNYFIGTNFFAMHALPPYADNVNSFYLWFFQWAFAATACTIVSGAIAERTKFEAYIIYSFFMAAWVYPIVVHACWSQSGWESHFRTSPSEPHFLVGSGVIDFAGSGVVHMTGGFAAAAGCWVLGPRMGRFLPDGTVSDYSGHNTSLFVLGVFILWFGWYGFNPGSQLAIVHDIVPVSSAAVSTTLGPACAGLSSLFTKTMIAKFTNRGSAHFVYDVGKMGNGALCGLAAITGSCAVIHPWAAIVIGLVAGFGFVCFSQLVVWCRLDDPLDAISVHAFGGVWGVFATGFFAAPVLIDQSYPVGTPRDAGVFLGGSGRLLAAQLIHIVWVAGWVLANMIPFFWILKKLHLFRVSPEDEALGLDASYHGGSAYPGESESDVAFSWGPSPLERSNGKPLSAPKADATATVPTTNVILSKEAKAQQRTIETMQSDIMDLQNTVWKLMSKQQEQQPQQRRGSPEQGMRPGQSGAKATALQPLEDLRLRPRGLTHPQPSSLRQQSPQQLPPDGFQSTAAAANDKQL